MKALKSGCGSLLQPIVFILLGFSVYLAVHGRREDFISGDVPEAMREAANRWLETTLPPLKVEKNVQGEFDRVIKMVNETVPADDAEQQKFGLAVSIHLNPQPLRDDWPEQTVRQAFTRLCELGNVRCRLNARGQFIITPK